MNITFKILLFVLISIVDCKNVFTKDTIKAIESSNTRLTIGEIKDIVEEEVTTRKNQIVNKNKIVDFKPLSISKNFVNSEVLNYLQEFGIVDRGNSHREKKSTSNNEELLMKLIENLEELKTLNISINDTNVIKIKNNYTTENVQTILVSKRQSTESKETQVKNLEDSFGAGDIDKSNQSELPGKKKNGFYLLADWNSFLEVGDGEEKVVVRLNKTIGDPSLFIPIKIP
ncbi:hypothetical protein ACFFRR_005396 [Megaselia abdita]